MKKRVVGAVALLAAAVLAAGVIKDRFPGENGAQSGSQKETEKKETERREQKKEPNKEEDKEKNKEQKKAQENDGDGGADSPAAEGKRAEVREYESKTLPGSTDADADRAVQEPVFECSGITDEIFIRMYGNSYKEDCTVPRDSLSYLTVTHYGFDGEVHTGEMVVNQAIAEDVLEIFRELYEIRYPIEKMRLIDDYGADDERSMADNNSSAFNYRVISGTTKLSNHSRGLAIDINPLYNPYVHSNTGEEACEPANATPYVDRSLPFDYKIDEDDACYRIFTEHGFSWGGSWSRSKDYQHFEKTDVQ